jgi:hypothetical protein
LHFRHCRFGRRYSFWGSRFSTDTAPTTTFIFLLQSPPLFLSLSLKSSRNMSCVNLSTWVQTCSMFSKQADLDPRLSKIYPFRSYPQNDDDPSHLSPSMRCSPSWTLLEKKRNQNQRQRTFNFKTYMLQKANSVNQALDAPNRL